jgi:hypothetical protein
LLITVYNPFIGRGQTSFLNKLFSDSRTGRKAKLQQSLYLNKKFVIKPAIDPRSNDQQLVEEITTDQDYSLLNHHQSINKRCNLIKEKLKTVPEKQLNSFLVMETTLLNNISQDLKINSIKQALSIKINSII